MQLRTKFLALSALCIASVAVQVGLQLWVKKQSSLVFEHQKTISQVIKRHMDADMMHDAIRADVLTAILAASEGDPKGVSQAKEDLREHASTFQQDIVDNKKESLPPKIDASYNDAMQSLEAYVRSGGQIIGTLERGEDVTLARRRFTERFEAMEASNAAVTEHIEAWAEETERDAHIMLARSSRFALALSAFCLLAALAVPLMAVFGLFRPQRQMITLMDDFARGDYRCDVAGTDRKDEIGDIARAVAVFKRNGEERLALEREQEKVRAAEAEEAKKRAARAELTEQFANRMQGIIQNVAAAATQLYQTSELMGRNIADASQRLSNVAQASTETSGSVQSVAAAAEQLTSTVHEIAQQVTHSTDNVRNAVEQVALADTIAASLGDATQQIGHIVDVIQGIANQINLLALNATIESARAGEAGKGFAVVANEVKTLADQTSKATDQIASNIGSIQDVSQQVIGTLNIIKMAIDSVNETSAAISAAVEEQNATTGSIASNMTTAAHGTRQIDGDIREISHATHESSNSASQVLDAAKMLSQQSESLRQEVETFIRNMAA